MTGKRMSSGKFSIEKPDLDNKRKLVDSFGNVAPSLV